MKIIKITLAAFVILFIGACSSKKKPVSTVPAVAVSNTTAPTAPANPAVNTVVAVKPKNGIYPPGNAELNVMSMRYNDITLEHLNEGYRIYTKGACTNCHIAFNIYQYDEARWKHIVDDMAQKAMISDLEKDAVYKYVLAIKATQPK